MPVSAVSGPHWTGRTGSRPVRTLQWGQSVDVPGPVTAPGALTIEVTRGRSESMVSVSGLVAIDTSPRLRAALLEAIQKRLSPVLAVDMAGVSYLDTSGVATLLEASRLARAHGVRLRVVGLAGEPEMLARVLEMDRIFLALGSDVEFR